MRFIKRLLILILVLVSVVVAAVFYAVKIEPYRIVVGNYELGKKDGESIRIVQVSDIQISDSYNEERLAVLVDKINLQNPDIVLFTGDLYENYAKYGPEDAVMKELRSIRATLVKIAIYGNRDYGGGASRHYLDIIGNSGFVTLCNTGVNLTINGDKRIYIAGLDDALLGAPDIDPIKREMSEKYDYRILLTHEPDVADDYADLGFDLILAGHSHGGQVRIPLIQAYTTSLGEKYVRGFYSLGKNGQTKLYVNPGIGTSHYPVRFGVPPEITVFDIGL